METAISFPNAGQAQAAGKARLQVGIIVGLMLLTICVFAQTRKHDFVNFDDETYVMSNLRVIRAAQQGVQLDDIAWAFTTIYAEFWHPVTWISLMCDATLFGLDPAGFHLTNVVLHCASVLVLYAALQRMTGAIWKSACVAALFAVHPLRAESVAWIAERKDVLSILFGVISIWAYAKYAQCFSTVIRQAAATPAASPFRWYLLSFTAYGLSLMSKPTLVTLPCLLLLLDGWPLARRGPDGPTWRRLVGEKLPMFLLTIAFCGVAWYADRHASGNDIAHVAGVQDRASVKAYDVYSWQTRCLNAVDVYVIYLRKTIWPHDLACYYPYPLEALSLHGVFWQASLLLALTAWAARNRRRSPFLLVGWLWYLGTLVPVLGLLQIGSHRMADRYTYLPSIGLFLAVTWYVPTVWPAAVRGRRVLAATTGTILLAYATLAWTQTATWADSQRLCRQALAATSGNYLVHYNLAVELDREQHWSEAIEHYQQAIRFRPDYANAHNNLGNNWRRLGQIDKAEACYRSAVRLRPHYAFGYHNLGVVALQRGDPAAAIDNLRQSICYDPTYAPSHELLGTALHAQEQFDAAITHFEAALALHRQALAIVGGDASIRQDLARRHMYLGRTLLTQSDAGLAEQHYRQALQLAPHNPLAAQGLRQALWRRQELQHVRERDASPSP